MPVYCMCLYIILDASQAAAFRALHKRVFIVQLFWHIRCPYPWSPCPRNLIRYGYSGKGVGRPRQSGEAPPTATSSRSGPLRSALELGVGGLGKLSDKVGSKPRRQKDRQTGSHHKITTYLSFTTVD